MLLSGSFLASKRRDYNDTLSEFIMVAEAIYVKNYFKS